MAGRKAESFVLHSGGTATEYPLLDAETYESLVSAVIRIAKLENTADSHDAVLAAVQSAVEKLEETDTDSAQTLKDLDARITRAQNTADSNTKKYQEISETVANEQTKLANEVERAKDVEGDISDLNTAVRDSLVAAINYLLTRADKNAESIGTLTDLTTDARTDIVQAVNELESLKADRTDVETMETKVDNAVAKVETLENTVNNSATEVSAAVTSVNAAVDKVNTMQNAIDGKADQSDVALLETEVGNKADASVIGDLSNLTTTEKSTLVGAINEAAASGGGGTSVNVISPQTVTTAPSTTSKYDVAIGSSAKAEASGAIAIGNAATASGWGSVAIGCDLTAGYNAVAIGPGAYADSNKGYAVAIGYSTNSHGCGDNSVAIGGCAESSYEKGVAIGSDAITTGAYSVAIGSDSYTEEDYTVSVGSSSQTRRIVNVADPTGDQDAATKAYVDAQLAYIAMEAGVDVTAMNLEGTDE